MIEQSTKLISDIDTDRIEQWFTELLSIMSKKKPKLIGPYRTGQLYHTGDISNGYYYLMEGDEVVYFVRYRKITGGGNRFGRQVLVANRKGSLASVGVAMHVFYTHLLPKFKALITDTQQTLNGRAFWGYALDKAYETGKHVYFYDRRSTPNTLTLLETENDLAKVYTKIWGTTEGHLRTHAVISEIPIQMK